MPLPDSGKMSDVTTPDSNIADLITASGHIGYHWDLRADHMIWFGNWADLFGSAIIHPPHNAEAFATSILPEDQYLVFGGGSDVIDREYRLRLPDGHLIWVHEHGTITYENGRAICQRSLLRLIDEPQRLQSAISAGMERDPLTGRSNRTYMQAQITRTLHAAKDVRQQSAYLVVSIDKMAFINAAIGTSSTDALLCNVANRLAELIPTKALLARVGGDMFGILLPRSGA